MKQKMILYQPWGGLGDNLQFSTLPKLCYEHGVDFYLSSKNSYRNEEIKKLVWDCNPYVKGVTDEEPNAGFCKIDDWIRLIKDFSNSHISSIEKAHNFDSNNHLPKVYYKPKKIDYFENKVVLSLSCVSETYDFNSIFDKLKDVLDKTENVIQLDFASDLTIMNNNYGFHKVYETDFDEYICNSIFEHCDIIFSAKKYICLHSGNAVLSASLDSKNCHVLTMHHDLMTTKNYYFDNLNYHFI